MLNTQIYDKYTYATVKGAGHEVPMFQPAAAFHMMFVWPLSSVCLVIVVVYLVIVVVYLVIVVVCLVIVVCMFD